MLFLISHCIFFSSKGKELDEYEMHTIYDVTKYAIKWIYDVTKNNKENWSTLLKIE